MVKKKNYFGWFIFRKITTPNSLEIMTHVIHIIEVIGGYILLLTSSKKVGNNDTCKWKLQIILYLYNYTYNMSTNINIIMINIIYITQYNKIIFMCKQYHFELNTLKGN